MTRTRYRLLLIVLLTPLPQYPASAQTLQRSWLETELHFGKGSLPGPAFAGRLALSTPYGAFTLRAFGAHETFPLFLTRVPVEKDRDVGILYGRSYPLGSRNGRRRPVSFSASLGVGRATTSRRGDLLRPGPCTGSFIFISCDPDQYEAVRKHHAALLYEVGARLGGYEGASFMVSWAGAFHRQGWHQGLMVGLYVGFPLRG